MRCIARPTQPWIADHRNGFARQVFSVTLLSRRGYEKQGVVGSKDFVAVPSLAVFPDSAKYLAKPLLADVAFWELP
jgi:hypothetical protein